jgi:hypothetical protein
MVASNCDAILFRSLAHGLDIVYYKFQWVVDCPPQDNKNIHKAYKESREDDPFELKNISKSQLQMCQASNSLLHAIFDITFVTSSKPKLSIYNI